MKFDEKHKNKVGQQIALRLARAIGKKEISLIETPYVSRFILDRVDDIKTQEEMIGFLTELTQKWPFFEEVLALEKGEEVKTEEAEEMAEIRKQLAKDKTSQAVENANSAAKKE